MCLLEVVIGVLRVGLVSGVAVVWGVTIVAGLPQMGTTSADVALSVPPPAPTATPVPGPEPEVHQAFVPAMTRELHAWSEGEAGVSEAVLGWSVEGREIVARRLGEGDEVVVLIGGLHTGAERFTVDTVEGVFGQYEAGEAELPEGVTLVAIGVANPDGLALERRVNARGVDLNRNWPTEDWAETAVHVGEEVSGGPEPLSEPEVAALSEYLMAVRPTVVIAYHGYASIVEGNDVEEAEMLAAVYAGASGYGLLQTWPYYEITGELIVAMAEAGIPAFDVELDWETTVEEDVEKNARGVAAVLELLASGEPLAFPEIEPDA